MPPYEPEKELHPQQDDAMGAIHEQAASLHRLSEGSLDCIKMLSLDGTILTISENGLRLLEIADANEVLGKSWASFFLNHDETREAFFAARDAAVAGGTGRFQGYCASAMGKPMWWDVVIMPLLGADGKPEKLISTARDITAQREAEQKAERKASEVQLIADAAPLLISYIDADLRYRFANKTYETWFGRPVADFIGNRVEDIVGPAAFVQIRPRLLAALSGERVSYEGEMPYRGAGSRYVAIELVPDVAEDGASVRGYVAVITDSTERKLLEQERERLLARERQRAAGEALLNQIGTAVRSAQEPDEILRAALSVLGRGLSVDRCYFARYNQAQGTAAISPEWLREEAGAKSLEGHVLLMSSYPVYRDFEYKSGSTHIVDDVVEYGTEQANSMLAIDVRALLRVPFTVGNQLTALAVSMAFEPRHWTDEEVRVVENVAMLLHSTLESALLQQRERNIATQLQAALFPSEPPIVPGLSLKHFYRPALLESSVGGDFLDFYDTDEGCTALVVADLSGKGISAASNVAVVRNMLRFSLYNSESVSEAVQSLHRTLTQKDLLTGFATLFVGLWDHGEHTLTYVNCGQDAGLIWRAATGQVDEMEPTGPVLGGFASGEFEQRTVSLFDGDVLALFTDGLTEAGPTRKNLLGSEGVSDLLSEACNVPLQTCTATSVVDYLIRGVDNFARGGRADDIAVLVGIVGITGRSGSEASRRVNAETAVT